MTAPIFCSMAATCLLFWGAGAGSGAGGTALWMPAQAAAGQGMALQVLRMRQLGSCFCRKAASSWAACRCSLFHSSAGSCTHPGLIGFGFRGAGPPAALAEAWLLAPGLDGQMAAATDGSCSDKEYACGCLGTLNGSP